MAHRHNHSNPLDNSLDNLPTWKLRKLYKGIMERALARMDRDEFDEQVEGFLVEAKLTPETAKPVDWVRAAMKVQHHCRKCEGTGVYRWQTSFGWDSGTCYRCEGKGYQDDADRRRNWGYDSAVWLDEEAA